MYNGIAILKPLYYAFIQLSKCSSVVVYDMIYLLNCNWIATQWQQYSTHLHTNNTQNDIKQKIHRTTQKFLEECGPCPVFASYTLTFALQPRKQHGKTYYECVLKQTWYATNDKKLMAIFIGCGEF